MSDLILEELVLFLGATCALCHKKFPDGKSWTVHHRKYKKGEKTSKDFKERTPHIITRGKNKGKKTKKVIYHKYDYYTYLRPIVLKEPHRFVPLHNSCHMAVSRLSNWRKENRKRLCDLAMEQP